MLFQTRELLRSALMLALVVVIGSVASTAMAAPPANVPEIDPSSAASALAVLAGSGLILAERLGFRLK